ncbi:MAG: hypothetical protein DF221_12700 [Brevibacillus sp.]|nr:MAG: hypothetical protein DF221_12700 [Brevibacillus sp.]
MPELYLHLRLINMQAFRPDNDGKVSLRNLIDHEVHIVFSQSCFLLWGKAAQRVDKAHGAWVIGPLALLTTSKEADCFRSKTRRGQGANIWVFQ